MKTHHIKSLIKKYLDGKTSAKETFLVDAYIEDQLASNTWNISEAEKEILGIDLKYKIDQKLSASGNNPLTYEKTVKGKARQLWPLFAAAAMTTIIGFTVLYLSRVRKESPEVRFATDVKPGGNQAVLTLADGRKINLSASHNGELANLKGISVTKTVAGELVFSLSKAGGTEKTDKQNILETPLGGQYRVNLSDGTQVWINAGTTLKFPSHFSGANRKVELQGEAYFEVSKDSSHPFLVKSGLQEVKVLGTHFNINSYSNEPFITTTLLEGSIQLDNGLTQKIIAPGEQASLNSNTFKVREVEPAMAIDWKNGEFRFKNENLKSILRKLSRWYDVDFIMKNTTSELPNFTGSVSRFDQISVVLKMLEETSNVKFYISGKVITVK